MRDVNTCDHDTAGAKDFSAASRRRRNDVIDAALTHAVAKGMR